MTVTEYHRRMRECDQLIADAERRVPRTHPLLQALYEERGFLLRAHVR